MFDVSFSTYLHSPASYHARTRPPDVLCATDISTAFGCPFEGEISSKKIIEISKAYKSLGMKGVTLGDTTGMATPPVVTKVIRDIKEKVPDFEITLHFHNTRGVGLANVLVGLNGRGWADVVVPQECGVLA